MAEQRIDESGSRRTERWLVAALFVALVLFRSSVFIVWEEAQFDADQAVMGLMAKHISEGRAFPVFFYGSNHILAVQAWLAAPVFLLAGVSVATLKLPLVGIHLAIGLLLLRLFERDSGLRPALALAPILFFALPAPGTTAGLLEASGGNVEPMLYVLLLWLTRRRPALCGAIFGIGFLHREFTVYGLIALLVVEAFQGSPFTREALRRRFAMARTAVEVWLLFQVLRYSSSAAGPGTSIADIVQTHSNVTELTSRICLDLQTLPGGLWKLVTVHWPMLFGVARQPMIELAVDTSLSQGVTFGGAVLAATMLLAAAGVVYRLSAERKWRREYDFCAFLVLTGALSAVGYVIARCGAVDLMRYELLSVLGAVGLGAWFLLAQPPGAIRSAWIGLACACALITTTASVRLLAEYVSDRPVGARRLVARHLEAQGVRYGTSDYWLAYSLTFLTNERVILASEDFVRIATYDRIVNQHRGEAVRVSRTPCENGRRAASVWVCPLD